MSLFWYLVFIKVPETHLWFESIMSKPTTDSRGTFNPSCHYFLFYFKDRIKTTTTYTKQAFHLILRFLEVLVPNFMSKHLGYNNLDMGVFLILPLVLYSCSNLIWREYLLIFAPRQLYSFLKDIFKTKATESNGKKYVSCNIHCCTICPTSVRVAGKQIICSYIHLLIIWALKIVESFISDEEAELFQENH